MLNKHKIFILILLVVILALPTLAFAQDDGKAQVTTGSKLICPRPSGSTALNQPNELVQCVPRLYDFALGIAGLIAAGVIVASGYLMMTAGGNGQQLTLAKEMASAAAAGVVILLTAYMLLKFLNPDLLNLGSPNPFAIKIAAPAPTPGPASTTSDTAIRERLASTAAIRFANNVGSYPLSFVGMKTETVDEIIKLKTDCVVASASRGSTCDVLVTGGTEGGHGTGACSHERGYKFDFDDHDSTLNNYIRNNPSVFVRTPSKDRSNGDQAWRRGANGPIYWYERGEGAHWDVVVNCYN